MGKPCIDGFRIILVKSNAGMKDLFDDPEMLCANHWRCMLPLRRARLRGFVIIVKNSICGTFEIVELATHHSPPEYSPDEKGYRDRQRNEEKQNFHTQIRTRGTRCEVRGEK